MSQSSNPADTQALLQSMLQRLKLQPGREGQTHFQTPVSPSAAPALWPNSETGAPSLQEVNSSPVNVFNFNGSPAEGITISAASSTPGSRSEEKQPTSPAFEGSRSPTYFPLQKVATDGDTVEKRELEQVPQPRFSPTGTKPLFPAKPQKEVKLTFFKKTNAEREPIGYSLMTGQAPARADTVPGLAQHQNHVPAWSVTSTGPGLAGGGHAGFHVGNGGISGSQQNKDVQVFSSSQITANKTRKRSTESKTRRWTQKIKERFKDRHGNIGKKSKEDGIPEQEPQVIRAETMGSRTNNDEDCSHASKLHPAQTEDNTMSNNRRSSDIDIGLGSFSLLEEIAQGQEWAKFINPNLSTTSGTERPSEDPSSTPHVQPNPHSLNLSPGSLNQAGTGSNQWSFRSTESSPAPAFSSPQQVFPAARMDTSALKQQADQPEPMEDGQNRSEMLSRLQLKLSAFAETSGNPYHSIVRNRIQMSRKRQHPPAERREERLQTQRASDGEKTDRELLSSPSSASIQMMEESVEPQQESVSPQHEPRPRPIPLSPTSFNPAALPARSVLRQKAPHDPESSIETLTKRRRVEEKRQVHFCEQVTTIESPDMEFTDSEEDSGADEDSLFEPDFEAVQAEMDEALPARRSNLPAWIQALKRMNAGKKHR